MTGGMASCTITKRPPPHHIPKVGWECVYLVPPGNCESTLPYNPGTLSHLSIG